MRSENSSDLFKAVSENYKICDLILEMKLKQKMAIGLNVLTHTLIIILFYFISVNGLNFFPTNGLIIVPIALFFTVSTARYFAKKGYNLEYNQNSFQRVVCGIFNYKFCLLSFLGFTLSTESVRILALSVGYLFLFMSTALYYYGYYATHRKS